MAYYGLADSERSENKSHDPALEQHVVDDVASNSARADVLNKSAVHYAEDLIRAQSFAELLDTAARSRREHEDARVEWHASLVRSYKQLEQASTVAARTVSRAADIQADDSGLLLAAREHVAIAGRINAVMEPARKEMAALEGPRLLDLLFRAANALPQDLHSHYNGLVDLCLDQEAARMKLLVSCRRYASLMPILDRLVVCDGTIYGAPRQKLLTASSAIRLDLENRLDKGSGVVEGISLEDITRVRYLLGDSIIDLRHGFLTAAYLQLMRKRPTSKLFNDSTRLSPLSVCCIHLEHVKEAFLPELSDICDAYFRLFSSRVSSEFVSNSNASHSSASANTTDVQQDFALWLLQTMNNFIGEPVRQAVSNNDFRRKWKKNSVTSRGEDDVAETISLATLLQEDSSTTYFEVTDIGPLADAVKFRTRIDALREAADETKSSFFDQCPVSLEHILGEICDDLQEYVANLIVENARNFLNSALDTLIDRDYVTQGRVDVEAATFTREVNEIQEDLDEYLDALRVDRRNLVDSVFDRIAQKCQACSLVPVHDLEFWSMRYLLSSAVLSDSLSRFTSAGDTSDSAKRGLSRSQLIRAYTVVTARHVTEILQVCLNEHIVSDHSISLEMLTPGMSRAISVLERAQQEISVILDGIEDMQAVMGTQDDALDEGGIVQRIARGWVFALREHTLSSAVAVHRLQVDAAALARAIALPNAFDMVPRVAVFRCVEQVSLLDAAEMTRLHSHL